MLLEKASDELSALKMMMEKYSGGQTKLHCYEFRMLLENGEKKK